MLLKPQSPLAPGLSCRLHTAAVPGNRLSQKPNKTGGSVRFLRRAEKRIGVSSNRTPAGAEIGDADERREQERGCLLYFPGLVQKKTLDGLTPGLDPDARLPVISEES